MGWGTLAAACQMDCPCAFKDSGPSAPALAPVSFSVSYNLYLVSVEPFELADSGIQRLGRCPQLHRKLINLDFEYLEFVAVGFMINSQASLGKACLHSFHPFLP